MMATVVDFGQVNGLLVDDSWVIHGFSQCLRPSTTGDGLDDS